MKLSMRKSGTLLKIAYTLLLTLVLLTPSTLSAAEPNEVTLLNIGNIYRVASGPDRPSMFTLDTTFVITYIYTYHWNDGQGIDPGTISLINKEGEIYGPFQTNGITGQGGVLNAGWETYIEAKVPPGRYTILDSNPLTWSCNAESDYKGFAIVKGYRASN